MKNNVPVRDKRGFEMSVMSLDLGLVKKKSGSVAKSEIILPSFLLRWENLMREFSFRKFCQYF